MAKKGLQIFGRPTNFLSNLHAKRGFLLAVYVTLICQLSFTFYLLHYLLKHKDMGDRVAKYWLLWFLLSLATIFAIFVVPLPVQLLLFALLSALMSAMLYRVAKRFSPELIKAALLGTIGIFVCLSLVGVFLALLGYNLTFMYAMLMAVLVALFVVFVLLLFIPVPTVIYKIVLSVSLTLFSVYVVVDTNVILQKDYFGNFVTAALSFYLDFINIFQDLLLLSGLD